MTIIWYMVPEISTATDRFFLSSWGIFCPFTPLTAQKKKILKKWKSCLEISFYTSEPKKSWMIIGYTVPEIRCVTDVIIFHFGLFFALIPSNSLKNENINNKKKKRLEISFYTSVPKIMIICSTVTEIWCMTDVIIFHFGLFFALLPL